VRLPTVNEPSEGIQSQGRQQGAGKRATSEATREEQWAVLAKHSTDGLKRPGTWGTETQGTHGREGKAGHDALLGRKTGETLSSPTVSTKLQRIAEQAVREPGRVFTTLAHLIDIDFLKEWTG
jgi:hypothetical protein